ncbi:hypothetical protein HZA97_02735 [Candidatus Woesearchaeota archaeon]|nr:hypothetical protein [Candidatus Woesearchaeota archaeon]
MTKFTKKELSKICKDEIFQKKIKNNSYWIKPLYEYKTYPLGNHIHHKKYYRVLKEMFKKHIPRFTAKNFCINNKKPLLIIQEHIDGRKLRLREIQKLLKLSINKQFKAGLKLLLEKNWVLDFYAYYGNFIESKNHKIMYVDIRMPIFVDKKEERYKISKRRTLKLLDL